MMMRTIFTVRSRAQIRGDEGAASLAADQSKQFIASEKSGSLFRQLYEILTSTDEVDLEELPTASAEVKRSTVTIR